MTDAEYATDSEPRLLYVSTIAATIRHFLSPYGEYFRAIGWHVEAAANGAASDAELRAAFDEVHELPLSRSMGELGGLVRGYSAVAGLLRQGRPDIVHVHTPIAAAVTRLAARRMDPAHRPAVVYTAHGFHFHAHGGRLSNLVFRTIERVAGRWTDRLIVINAEDEEAARRHRIVPRAALVRLPGVGLDTSFYDPARVSADDIARVYADLGMPVSAPLFVAVGELNANKRHADAVEALGTMRERTARLILAGDGPLGNELVTLAKRLGLAGRVRVTGHVDDVRPLLTAATALVHPSRREGLSRAVMEALALGTPVIASAARGNSELVADNGTIVGIGDVAAMAAAMDEYAHDPEAARMLARTARTRIVDRYELRSVIQQHRHLYEALLATRQSRPSGAAPADGAASGAEPSERSAKS